MQQAFPVSPELATLLNSRPDCPRLTTGAFTGFGVRAAPSTERRQCGPHRAGAGGERRPPIRCNGSEHRRNLQDLRPELRLAPGHPADLPAAARHGQRRHELPARRRDSRATPGLSDWTWDRLRVAGQIAHQHASTRATSPPPNYANDRLRAELRHGLQRAEQRRFEQAPDLHQRHQSLAAGGRHAAVSRRTASTPSRRTRPTANP